MASTSKCNSILERLPRDEFGRISRQLESVPLSKGTPIIHPDKCSEYLYFPTGAVISFLGRTGGGGTIEIWSVSCEGAAGISGLLGLATPFSGVVQVPGSALRIKASFLREYLENSDVFRRALFEYFHYLLTQIACLGVCNNCHPLVQRLGRWLLIMGKRVDAQTLNFTQDAIAGLLGTRRATISVAAAELQVAGAITYTPGAITIKSRRELKRVSCSCYKAIAVKVG